MPINILELPATFFVYDAERHEEIEESARLVQAMQKGNKPDNEENRLDLKRRITPVFGFRQAEELFEEDLETVSQELEVKRKRQIDLRAYLGHKLEEASKRAAGKHSNPEAYSRHEVTRDACFYTVWRSGLGPIADILDRKEDGYWEKISGEIANGARLTDYLSKDLIDITTNFLPYTLVFNSRRAELMERLKSTGLEEEQLKKIERKLPKTVEIDLPEEEKKEVEGLLERCLRSEANFSQEFGLMAGRLGLDEKQAKELKNRIKKIVKGPFRLAVALRGLGYGRVDEEVLASLYKTNSNLFCYPLADEIATLDLEEYDMDHVHTKNARYLGIFFSTYMRGIEGLPIKLINHLGIEDVSKWSIGRSRLNLLDPEKNIDDKILGLYIGHFLFGSGSEKKTGVLRFAPKSKSREWCGKTLF